jgi:phosphoserine aminotransferase
MSSDILCAPRDYRKYALFYAVAQKNLGAAGATLVCIRKDFLQKEVRPLPDMLSYKAHVAAKGVLNTPPVFAVYTCLLMLRWLKAQGLPAVYAANRQKADALYAEISRNPLFSCAIEEGSRSIMNAVFSAKDPATEKDFLSFAAARGIHGIAGHRSTGGFRASIYNAVTVEDVQALITAMQEFAAGRQSPHVRG